MAHYSSEYLSPLGLLTLASDGDNLVGLWSGGQKYYGATLSEKPKERDDLPVFRATRNWLDRYFAAETISPRELPLAPAGGSAFRRAVWDILREIPYGEVITYGDIAKQMAVLMNREKMSSQAVGGAVGHNPISIIIPCHRVVGAQGNLTGYTGGLEIKIKLLALEGHDMSRFSLPLRQPAVKHAEKFL